MPVAVCIVFGVKIPPRPAHESMEHAHMDVLWECMGLDAANSAHTRALTATVDIIQAHACMAVWKDSQVQNV